MCKIVEIGLNLVKHCIAVQDRGISLAVLAKGMKALLLVVRNPTMHGMQ